MNKSTDNRGFTTYVSFQDNYGAEIRVKESSAVVVEGDDYDDPRGFVWVFIEGGALTGNKGSAHMTTYQAKKLRDALSAWLNSR